MLNAIKFRKKYQTLTQNLHEFNQAD